MRLVASIWKESDVCMPRLTFSPRTLTEESKYACRDFLIVEACSSSARRYLPELAQGPLILLKAAMDINWLQQLPERMKNPQNRDARLQMTYKTPTFTLVVMS